MAGKAPAPAGAAASSKAVGAPAGASAGAIRRRAGAQTRKQTSSMNFYTDDSPGMKLPPVMVIVGSVIFILIVTMLHVVGKITK